MVTRTVRAGESDQVNRRAIPDGTQCFYCGYPISGTVVLWWGESGDIHLHPGCTVELSIRLLRDVHEIERASQTTITGVRSAGYPGPS